MVYLPSEWILNPDNEDKIREILEAANHDIHDEQSATMEEVIQRLTEIGEAKVVDNLHLISFGA